MNARDDGGPAFARPGYSWTDVRGDFNLDNGETGMSLRDYFAAKIIEGWCAGEIDELHDFNPHWEGYKGGIPEEYANASRRAFLLADAMLAERVK